MSDHKTVLDGFGEATEQVVALRVEVERLQAERIAFLGQGAYSHFQELEAEVDRLKAMLTETQDRLDKSLSAGVRCEQEVKELEEARYVWERWAKEMERRASVQVAEIDRLKGEVDAMQAVVEVARAAAGHKFFDETDNAWLAQQHAAYQADPVVAYVPAEYGDTATGRHAADAEFIEHAKDDVLTLLAEVDRLKGETAVLELQGQTHEMVNGIQVALITTLRAEADEFQAVIEAGRAFLAAYDAKSREHFASKHRSVYVLGEADGPETAAFRAALAALYKPQVRMAEVESSDPT